MRRLLTNWASVTRRLRAARSIALFLDFDGTLAPPAADPAEAVINRAARAALLRLAANPRVDGWIVSGRRRADLRERVRLPGLNYLGVHGGDAAGAMFPESVIETVTKVRRELAARLNGTRGVLVEDKGIAFSVHHRNAGCAETARARKLLAEVVEKSAGALTIIEADRAWEVLPREIRGKGDAVRRIWRTRWAEGLPIYAGNDSTDETAFAALESGITIRVGAAPLTRAHYWVRDTGEVGWFLGKLEEEMRWGCRLDSNS